MAKLIFLNCLIAESQTQNMGAASRKIIHMIKIMCHVSIHILHLCELSGVSLKLVIHEMITTY